MIGRASHINGGISNNKFNLPLKWLCINTAILEKTGICSVRNLIGALPLPRPISSCCQDVVSLLGFASLQAATLAP
jgi:hypothetical protein